MPRSLSASRDMIQSSKRDQQSLLSADYKYNYPEGLNLRPGKPAHQKLLTRILAHAERGRDAVERRWPAWREIDQTLVAYIPQDDYERALKKKDRRKPVSIVIPHSFATLETLLTYMTSAFFQDPLFMYEGVGPEDTVGAMLLEHVVGLHCARSKVPLALHTLFRDSLAYGCGWAVPGWERRVGRRRRKVRREAASPMLDPLAIAADPVLGALRMAAPTYDAVEIEDDATLYEGNCLWNVDPYLALPDPDAPAHEPQRGQWFGWMEQANRFDLLSQERESPNDWFNGKYLRHIGGVSFLSGQDQSARDSRLSASVSTRRHDRPSSPEERMDVLTIYVKLIPDEWNLPSPEPDYPEKWEFTVVGDQVITRARKLDLDHGWFPVAPAAPDYDGYGSSPASRMEIIGGLQTQLNFLANSRTANIRKSLNDRWLVNPYLVNMQDMSDPTPGKLIRLTRSNWNGKMGDVVMPFPVQDVTQHALTDMQMTMDLMQRVSAATDATMGIMRSGGERRSATEFRGTQGSALSRIERIARILGLQAMQDIGFMFASNVQQFMEEPAYVKAVGRWEQDLAEQFGVGPGDRIKVDPRRLSIDYDVIVRDGSAPGSNFQAEAWVQVFQVIASQPGLYQAFDLQRMFLYMAQQLGAKNVKDFVRGPGPRQAMGQGPSAAPGPAQVVPDEQAVAQAQAGNTVPLDAATLFQLGAAA